jgi:ABC-type Na+ transport system ATPase subunit NatA
MCNRYKPQKTEKIRAIIDEIKNMIMTQTEEPGKDFCRIWKEEIFDSIERSKQENRKKFSSKVIKELDEFDERIKKLRTGNVCVNEIKKEKDKKLKVEKNESKKSKTCHIEIPMEMEGKK